MSRSETFMFGLRTWTQEGEGGAVGGGGVEGALEFSYWLGRQSDQSSLETCTFSGLTTCILVFDLLFPYIYSVMLIWPNFLMNCYEYCIILTKQHFLPKFSWDLCIGVDEA